MSKQIISNDIEDFMVGEIHISLQHNTLSKGDKTCRIQPKAMAVLHYLASHNDRVINNDELIEQVWQGRIVTNSSVQKSINALRTAFKNLDENFDYLVYFSKRGYQLLSPTKSILVSESVPSHYQKSKFTTQSIMTFSAIILFTILVVYLVYLFTVNKTTSQSLPKETLIFKQVQPFASNTGREKIIAPHFNSKRIAYIREETPNADHGSDNTSNDGSTLVNSTLYIQSATGRQWQASTARGKFVNLAWSASGRNLVAIDAHHDNNDLAIKPDDSESPYYSFHIYTFDYKAEKVIEKNLLSHWFGNVNSVTWWDENTLEFIASHGNELPNERYRYDIAEQNLSTLSALPKQEKLLKSDIFNKHTAILSLINNQEHIAFLNNLQQVTSQWPLPFKVKSMHWLSHEQGLLLLTNKAELFMLYTDGVIQAVNYAPKVKGTIKHARSKNKGKSIVLTVNSTLDTSHKNNNVPDSTVSFSQTRLLAKGGGFIYSASSAQ